jgi:hypothetical protein
MIRRFYHKVETVTFLFDSQGAVHKELASEKKTINAELYKRVMNRLLKCIQRVHLIASPLEFLFYTIMRPPTKLQVFANFWPQKNVTTLYSPDLSPPGYFLFLKFKTKLKRLHFADFAEIQEVVSDELKKVHKEKFSAVFQQLYKCAKTYIRVYIFANVAYFQWKGMCFPHVSSI